MSITDHNSCYKSQNENVYKQAEHFDYQILEVDWSIVVNFDVAFCVAITKYLASCQT